jgi:DNA-binding NarL/FixJ family response regulator
MMEKVKILVVDQHPVMRLGIMALLRPENDIRTIGAAEGVDDALRLIGEEQPDIVVLDFSLKGLQSGTELCRQIKSRLNPPRVIFYTAHHAEEQLFLCRLSGADSYVHKEEEPEKLIEAIRQTHAGKRVWFISDGEGYKLNRRTTFEQASLTPREREVLGLMLKRYANSHIAKELGISLQTVKNHASNVLRKLGVNRRTDLPWEQP